MRNKCNRDDCKFIHDSDICRFLYNRAECKKGDECSYKHDIDGFNILQLKTERKKKRVRNTEFFEPDHSITDMRIIDGDGGNESYNNNHCDTDVGVVHGLCCEVDDKTIFDNILKEVSDTKLWHGDSHYIADYKHDWKDSSPTFNTMIKKLAKYFNMDVQATRLNWYKNTDEWKPFHHDAAAVKKDKAATQNFTVGVERMYVFNMQKQLLQYHLLMDKFIH
jgi:hypothetical protein